MLIPVELQGSRQVVDLGQAQVFRPDTGLGIGGVDDLVLEHPVRCGHYSSGIRCNIGQFRQVLWVAWGDCADPANRRYAIEGAEVFTGEFGVGNDQRGGAVGRGADVQQSQRVGHHRAGQYVLD